MNSSRVDHSQTEMMHKAWELSLENAAAVEVQMSEDAVWIRLSDGRELSVPIVWFPRLSYATPEEREHHELVADGTIIEWPDLDDGVEVAHLLLGWKSGESDRSLQRWLDERAARKA